MLLFLTLLLAAPLPSEPGVMPNPAARPIMVGADAKPPARPPTPMPVMRPAPEVRAPLTFPPAGVLAGGGLSGRSLTDAPSPPLVRRPSATDLGHMACKLVVGRSINDHQCEKCGAFQWMHMPGSTRADGSHAHQCPQCHNVWWHGGSLGYPKR